MVKQNSQGFRTALFFFHIPMLNFHNSEAELSQGTWIKNWNLSLIYFWDQLGSYLTVIPLSVNLTWTELAAVKSLGNMNRKSPWRTSVQFMQNRLFGTGYWKLSLSTLRDRLFSKILLFEAGPVLIIGSAIIHEMIWNSFFYMGEISERHLRIHVLSKSLVRTTEYHPKTIAVNSTVLSSLDTTKSSQSHIIFCK